MPEPINKVPYALMDSLDQAIERHTQEHRKLSKNEIYKRKGYVSAERNKIKAAAEIQTGLKKYRSDCLKTDPDDLEADDHCSSRLGDNLRASGQAKPDFFYHAHAIISGSHERAWLLRTLLAENQIGVDDSHNGCWLPSSSKYTGRAPFPEAVPHSRIHRTNYYLWLDIRFQGNLNKQDIEARLLQTRLDLQHSTFPEGVMDKKGEWQTPNDNGQRWS